MSTAALHARSGSSRFNVTEILRRPEPTPTSLVCLASPRAAEFGAHFAFWAPFTTLGRARDNDIVLESPAVSRQHARIERTPSGHVLVDLDSTNGTYLNHASEALTSAPLRDGDVVQLGDIELVFLSSGAEDPVRADRRAEPAVSAGDRIRAWTGRRVFSDPFWSKPRGAARVFDALCRRGGVPLGWWLALDEFFELESGHAWQSPLVGWRKERCPDDPGSQGCWPGFELPSRQRPDWVLEWVSDTDRQRKGPSAYAKLGFLAAVGIAWCWLVDERERSITVLRFDSGSSGYVRVPPLGRTGRVALPPFESEPLLLESLWREPR